MNKRLQRYIYEIIKRFSSEKNPIKSSLIRMFLYHSYKINDYSLRQMLKEDYFVERHIYGCRNGFYIAKTREGFLRGISWQEGRISKIAKNVRKMRKEMKRLFPKQLEIEGGDNGL